VPLAGFDGSAEAAPSDLSDELVVVLAESVSDLFELALLERSFLAQPEPLNTIAGADIAFRTGAPQTGQLVGPAAWTPWITSVTCPFEQT